MASRCSDPSPAHRPVRRGLTPWLLIALGDWQIADALVPLVMLAAFPLVEWIIHVFVLHWKPRTIAGVTLAHCGAGGDNAQQAGRKVCGHARCAHVVVGVEATFDG